MAVELKYEWINAVKGEYGPKSSTTRYVLLMLSTHMNIDGSNCFPSIALLSAETKLSKRVVGLHLSKAEALGWIKRQSVKSSGQAWRRYNYQPCIPKGGYLESAPSTDNVVTQGNQLSEKGGYSDAQGGYSDDTKVVTQGNTSIPMSITKSISSLNNVEDTVHDEKIIKKDIPQSTDSFLLAEHLLNSILARRKTFKQPRLNTWAEHIDRMLGRDKRTSQEIRAVIDWCQADPFWQNNILSTRTLREKFDQLALLMNSKKSNRKTIGQSEPFTKAGYYD